MKSVHKAYPKYYTFDVCPDPEKPHLKAWYRQKFGYATDSDSDKAMWGGMHRKPR